MSFDLGYMLVYQQKASGYQYDPNHTLRWWLADAGMPADAAAADVTVSYAAATGLGATSRIPLP